MTCVALNRKLQANIKWTVYCAACMLTAVATGSALGAEPVDFVRDVRPIFDKHCIQCHSADKQESGFRLDVKAKALQGGDNLGPDILPGQPGASPLVQLIRSTDPDQRMPPEGNRLSDQELDTITRWIAEGARWPDGVDRVQLRDLRDHWSLKPTRQTFAHEFIDQFIDARLAEHGLQRSPPAPPSSWLRRVTLDLTGLPPTAEEVDHFAAQLDAASGAADQVEAAYGSVVDRLLASPRYGERWAQHWLDVVRYADTHGFEVNTERPNAWPYRDYVIAALNNDVPYDQFIRQQIAGDAMGEDAATGFLITASVLLPGQIGKDAPSIRLARQDALDEIVNNIGQTFLALSVGCARCHDHKFDPISSYDYYALQAYVAGVEYEDREMRTVEAEARKQQAIPLREQADTIDQQLLNFVPLARPGFSPRPTNARENVERIEPTSARFVRFTIHDANLHPALGLIEPCIDELEFYGPDHPQRNLALAANGVKVSASGSRTSDQHKLEHIHDGQTGNSHSWMSDTAGRGWVLFELPSAVKMDRIVWSRDRTGQFTDRLATAFRLELGESLDAMQTFIDVPPLRPAVNRRLSTDRFAPVTATRLRMTILATNSLEPCIDELEVFNEQGENIALASRGTRVTTSGNQLAANRHDPSFLNDGKYGNSHSWLGNETGCGWVELAFPGQQSISRIHWSRDREGSFEDRLPTDYRIEVIDDGPADVAARESTPIGRDQARDTAEHDRWRVVADASDRRPWVAGMDLGPQLVLGGLSDDEARRAMALQEEKRILEARIKSLETGQLAFAGKFRTPDEIRLLRRGDPEQPGELVVPTMLSALGSDRLAADTPEQARRLALANWIATADNPLTARVMVNRIWQGHFGIGIVDTSSDFGHNGSRPTHPELLDWLANRFVQSGWSIKHMHRLIVLSHTYRQSSAAVDEQAMAVDADARWLWRYPSRRLDAEVIRDACLAITGELNLDMYGRGFDLFDKRGGLSGFKPVESFVGEGLRRMVYAHKVRRERDAVFGAFDCPDAGQSTARRRESTTPLQALNLLNSTFTIERAKAFAERVQQLAGPSASLQVIVAYKLALGRTPDSDELDDCLTVANRAGMTAVCRALLNSNEALFLP